MDWLFIELPSFLRQIYYLIGRKTFQNVSSMKEIFFSKMGVHLTICRSLQNVEAPLVFTRFNPRGFLLQIKREHLLW
jgi:hypothetical protein